MDLQECEKRSAGGLMREGGGVFAGFYGTTLQWQCSSECAWGVHMCSREHQLRVSLHSVSTYIYMYHTIIGESVC